MATIFVGPLIGKMADKVGKFRVFVFGTVLSIVMVLIYTHLGHTPLLLVVLVNVVMFLGIFSRMIPFQALVASVPDVNQRGAFSAVSASIQQLSGGLASVIAGHMVAIDANGKLMHFDVVGYTVAATSLVCLFLVWRVERSVNVPQVAPAH